MGDAWEIDSVINKETKNAAAFAHLGPCPYPFDFCLLFTPSPLPTPQPPSSSINLPPLLSVCVITAFFAVIFSQHINNNYMPKFT